jgi:DNA-binding transcriptional LysR family regulator
MDLNELLAFTRVVQAGSFTAAARMIGLPKSTLSRKVADLEERVGTRLLQRTTRKLGLTDAGRVYFGYCERIVAEAEEAERAISSMQASPRGLLRVSAPLSFALLGPVIVEFLKRYPEVQLELMCSDRRVDLVEEGFDLAVRVGRLEDSSLIVRPLGALRHLVVASPAYCRRNGTPSHPDELGAHTTVAFSGHRTPTTWTLQSGDARVEVKITPRVTMNDLDILAEVVSSGLGVALVPESVIGRRLREGSVVQLVPEWQSDVIPLQVVYPTARHLSPKVAAFTEFLTERFGQRSRGRE